MRAMTPSTRTRSSAFVLALVLCVGVLFPSVPLGGAQDRSAHVHQRVVRVPSPWGERKVAVTWSRAEVGVRRDTNLPTLVALHGKAESLRGPDRGFLGWVVDYRLPDAFGALQRGALTRQDYGGRVRDEHLRQVNAALESRAFKGLCVVTPFTPDLLDQPVGSPAIQEFGDWVATVMLPHVRQRFEALSNTRELTAIDGVSLGGRLSLEVGLTHGEAFGAVGATQPAITRREQALATLATSTSSRPNLRLLSSDRDPFLAATQKLSELLREQQVPHSLSVVPGPHNARFNRGPGAIEMLFHYDRLMGGP